ncbi:MAG: hypothetical protein ACXVKA_08970 [Acidimicrobiia bacterium]
MTHPLNATEKLRVRDALMTQIMAALSALGSEVDADREATSLNEADAHQVDDLSQSDESGELAGLTAKSAAQLRRQLAQLEQLDFSPTDEVAPGAIMGFDARRYVVGIAAMTLESGGRTYEGIAVDSPIYACIAGLRAGDTFTFRGAVSTIDFVG